MFSCTLFVRVKGDAAVAVADEVILCCTVAAEQEGLLGEMKADADEAVARMVARIDDDRVMILVMLLRVSVMEEVLMFLESKLQNYVFIGLDWLSIFQDLPSRIVRLCGGKCKEMGNIDCRPSNGNQSAI